MNNMSMVLSVLVLAAVAAISQSAWADTSDATCRFYKNGDKDQKRSGPCTFSQRQGNISIDLDSGDTIKLSPRNKADQFKDQDGDKVVRSGSYGNTQVFKWDDKNKKLIVNFNDTNYDRGHHGNRSDKLDDLQGMSASSGERELGDRGYYHRKTERFMGTSTAYWWNPQKQRCIAASTKNGRYSSIENQPESKCGDDRANSGGHHGGGHGGTDDLVGMRASSGERELEDRGYKFANSSKGSDRIWANWWNRSEHKCITVVTKDGKYDSITDTLPADCDEGGSSDNKHSGDYKDLVGARASSAESGLKDLGFRNVDGFKQGTTAYTIWYDRTSRECLQMATADGRADSIVDIQTHKKCH